MKNNHVTRLEIDLNAVENNLRCLKSRLKESTRVMAVVKAFAYGSSAAGMATFLQDKVDYFAVAYTPEGMALRAAGIEQPIMVLHPH
ncbi:MAG: alanine racemase, partial [Lutibacter sp.]|nr:alanine racemase [Lutibacter sp.]